MADFIDIFGEDFSSVLASLDELPPQVESMLLGVMDKMVYDVRTFSNSLEKTVFSMSQAGMSEDMIKQTLANDMGTGGSIFGKLRNDTKASIVDGINQSAKLGQYQNYDLNKGTFTWISVGGHRICGDCDGRAGQTLTFSEWEAEGLPGSGWSFCQGFCYCVLDPTGKMSKKVDAPVKEPGKKAVATDTAWKKTFNSDNIPANKAFQDTFQNSNDKFKEFLTKLPQIKHIDSGKGGSFFTEAGLKNIKGVSDASIQYAKKHGRINMSGLDGAYNASVIRHEFGHFIHHNIHHRGFHWNEINALLKEWKDYSKLHGNKPKDFLKKNNYINGRINAIIQNDPTLTRGRLFDSLEDLLKFDDAFTATNTKLGNPRRTKLAKEISFKNNRKIAEIRLRVQYGNNIDDIPDWIKRQYNITDFKIPINDKFINTCIADKAEDMWGIIADLYGAVTKELLGYGHGKSYYNKSGLQMQFHETFANLTTCYSHKNPIYWEYVKKEMPALAKHFESLIEKVNSGKLSVN